MKWDYLKTRFVIILTLVLLAGFAQAGDDGNDTLAVGDQKIVLNFQNALISEVLDYLSETAGLVIICEDYLDGRINLVSKQPISIDETISLINSILKEKEYAALRTGRTLKLVPIEQAKHLDIPVSSGSDPNKIIPGDDLMTHIIPIRYADAVSLKEDVSSLVPEYAVLSANEASNSLIMTDTSANIRRMINIVQALDTQLASIVDVKVFHLVYADAENVADLLNEVFDQESNSSSSKASQSRNPFERMTGFRGGPGGGGRGSDRNQKSSSSSSSSSGPDVSVIAAADEQTNAVVVSGPSDTLEVVAKVITDLDSNPDEERTIFIYALKNAQADNIKETLNSLFQEMQQINEENSSGGGGGTQRGNSRSSSGSGSSSSSSSDDISDEVYLEADEDTNSLLIMTSAKNYEKIQPIIEELDKPIPQVLIKVLLAEVTTTDDTDLGAEFSVLNLWTDSDGATVPLFESEFLASDLGDGMATRILRGDIGLTLNALQEVGDLNVLSRPYILTSNNQTATITVGSEVPFIRSSQISTDTGQTINTIEYEDIGIILEVTPSINPDGLVIMDVAPEISTTTAETVPISETVNAAVFAKRSSETRVAVPNGQTIVIGGLMQDKETESIQKVPLLGDIPLLGALFKNTSIDKEKTELLIFLTPQVARGNTTVKDISDHERLNMDALNENNANEALRDHIMKLESVYK